MLIDTQRWIIIPADVQPSPNFETRWHYNERSGHWYSETVDLEGFNVQGHQFSSEQRAEEFADYLNTHKPDIPMSRREIATFKRMYPDWQEHRYHGSGTYGKHGHPRD